MTQLFLYLILIVVSTAVVWQGSFILEDAADHLSTYYRLPPIVQGAVVTAIGSSFPELSSTVIATLVHGKFELGVAAIIGSAIFNILVIPGLSGILGQPLVADRILVYKDAQFYITSVTVLLLTFAFALIYNPVEGVQWQGMITRPIALIPIALYGLYLFLQYEDTAEHEVEDNPDSTIQVGKQWLLLLLSLALIVGGVEGLVRSSIALGNILGTPTFLWGVTVIAAATSLPDAFVSIRAARLGQSMVSLANVLGSNIFDLLIAIPIGVLLGGASVVNFSVAVPMMGFLILATIVLFASLRRGLILTKFESWVLLILYIAFLAWMALETVGITSLVFDQVQ
ncbi:MAG: sodium:calcium antiporter [Cyanobacteriota bacterium]